jgi:hypothetical protein
MYLKLTSGWATTFGLITCLFGLPLELKADQPETEPKAVHFSDGFDADHDFLSQGVADRGWDGLLGKGPRETADRIVAADGKLYLQSTRGRYQEGWNPLGPLLYKTVTGDFKATVRVVDYEKLSYNNCGIMARVANLDDAGPGEDWMSELSDGKTYYWRVDEVTDGQVHQGEIWSFTVYDRNLATFEDFGSTDDLVSQWVATGDASVTLATTVARSGRQSLKLEWNEPRSSTVQNSRTTLLTSLN